MDRLANMREHDSRRGLTSISSSNSTPPGNRTASSGSRRTGKPTRFNSRSRRSRRSRQRCSSLASKVACSTRCDSVERLSDSAARLRFEASARITPSKSKTISKHKLRKSDSSIRGFLKCSSGFTIVDPAVALDEPSESNSGRYWYNLHVVLVVASRGRIRSEEDFAKLDHVVQATAEKHQYGLAARAWMPDHLHVALRGQIEQCPGEITLSIMNNTAFAMGQNAIWQPGFYVGTLSEYDVRAVGR